MARVFEAHLKYT